MRKRFKLLVYKLFILMCVWIIKGEGVEKVSPFTRSLQQYGFCTFCLRCHTGGCKALKEGVAQEYAKRVEQEQNFRRKIWREDHDENGERYPYWDGGRPYEHQGY